MKTVLFTLSALVLAVSNAAACTPDELQAKTTEFTTQMQTLVAKDPVKAGEVAQRLAEQQIDTASVDSLDSACKLYDDMLAEIAPPTR